MLPFTPWQGQSGPPPLGPGDLHLWRIGIGAADGSDPKLLRLLGAEEQARLQRLANATLRARYARAHADLRRILGLYLDLPPAEIAFAQGAHGKPALTASQNPARLEFNLTGSGDLALLVISLEVPVGVDCEQIRPCRELLGIARRMFSPQVAQALADTPEPERLDAFYTAWTALEAEVKADGRGLFRPRAPRSVAAGQVLGIAHCRPLPGYLAAVARQGLPPVEQWGTHHLVDSGRPSG